MNPTASTPTYIKLGSPGSPMMPTAPFTQTRSSADTTAMPTAIRYVELSDLLATSSYVRPAANRRTKAKIKSPSVQFQPCPSTPSPNSVNPKGISSRSPVPTAIRIIFFCIRVMWLTTLDHTSFAVGPKRARMPNSECHETEPDSPGDEQQASYSSEGDACGHHFLCENEQREANDPNQVHYASKEQESH